MLSKNCQDLIFRMLNPDCVNRITIKQISKHPWFIINIPNHLNYEVKCLDCSKSFICVNDFKPKYNPELDEEIFSECLQNSKLLTDKLDEDKLKKRILKNKQDAFSVCYRMLTDAKQKEKILELNKLTLEIGPIFTKSRSCTESKNNEYKANSSQDFELKIPRLMMPHN